MRGLALSSCPGLENPMENRMEPCALSSLFSFSLSEKFEIDNGHFPAAKNDKPTDRSGIALMKSSPLLNSLARRSSPSSPRERWGPLHKFKSGSINVDISHFFRATDQPYQFRTLRYSQHLFSYHVNGTALAFLEFYSDRESLISLSGQFLGSGNLGSSHNG